MKISICIPMYNESAVIADTARTLSDYMEAHFDDYEILFCDDGSRDGSADIVRALELKNVIVTGYSQNHGKGCAIRTAMLEAKGDCVMFTDADLAYGTDVIAQAVQTFEANPEASLVIGSRNLNEDGYEGYTAMRRLASKAYIRLLCLVGGFRLTDSQCGCKAFRGVAAKEIFSRCTVNGFAFDFEALLWSDALGMTIREMPVKVINHRESKIRLFSDAFKMMWDLLKMKKRIRRAVRADAALSVKKNK